MSSELLAVFEYLEREKGISRNRIIEAIEASLLTASKKAILSRSNLSVSINPQNADIKVYAEVEVVGYPTDDPDEIYLDEAIAKKKDVKEGEKIKIEVTPKNFGRIAAQTAKQVIIQKLREAEKDLVVDEFRNKVGELVTGIVRRLHQGNAIVDIEKAEALLPTEEQVPGERCHPGMRLTALVIAVREGDRGPEIVLSRKRPELITKLFALEIPEIVEKTVIIRSIAREAGVRTKIAVASTDKRIDSVGACVGMRGARVKNIVRELNGEKIDIIRWDPNIEAYIKEALSPASPMKIELDDLNKVALVVVKDDEYSLAIGKGGQNARLTSKLIGWKIDIVNETRYQKKGHKLVERLMEIPGIGKKIAEELSREGFLSIEEIADAEVSKLTAIGGLGEKTAMKIQELIRIHLEAEGSAGMEVAPEEAKNAGAGLDEVKKETGDSKAAPEKQIEKETAIPPENGEAETGNTNTTEETESGSPAE
jgi:transcription termination/antitermination protein NusA